MRAVWSWLRELVELPREVSVDEAGATFTSLGLELERIEPLAEGFAGVVIAEVVDARPHPQADKLTVVRVIDAAGAAATEVVCGASNVPGPGGRVLWARPGATLPGGVTIAAKALKGVTSAGMLCSETELGIGDDGGGIVVLAADEVAALGAQAQDALGLRDAVLELSIAANRPDLLGHLGLARELAARLGGRLRPPAAPLADVTGGGPDAAARLAVAIEDPTGSPRYTARLIDGVTVGRSPRWLRWRLAAVGVRALSNLVDVTNYVLFETGQPLHAFDAGKVRGERVVVRRARPGERLTTLDGVDRALEPGDLVIADGQGGLALAGVMGGLDSEIGPASTSVVLESAAFDPIAVRRTSRRLGLRSEASQRFERGVDVAGVEHASARAAYLLATLGGGRVAPGVATAGALPPPRDQVRYRPARARALTGVDLDVVSGRTLLERLGCGVALDGEDLLVTPPAHRADLGREVDLIEDVIRLHGLEHVPATLPRSTLAPTHAADARASLCRLALTAAGLDEAITYGFTSAAHVAALRWPTDDRRARPLALKNPMSLDHAVMRTALLGNLIAAVARARSHGVPDVRLFEVGRVFLPADAALPEERLHVAGVLAGGRPGWLVSSGPIDFYDLKGAVLRLLAELLGAAAERIRYVAGAAPAWAHPGVSAAIDLDGVRLGALGEIDPRSRAGFGLDAACFGFELDLEEVPVLAPRQMRAIPRFPAVTRDLSFLVDQGVPAERVRELLAAPGDPPAEAVTLLEDYRDPVHVPAGKKGMLWSVTYRHADRTLTDVEVEQRHEARVVEVLAALGATRR